MRFSFLRWLFDVVALSMGYPLSMKVEPPEPWPPPPDPIVYCRSCSRRLRSKRSMAAGIGPGCRRIEREKEHFISQPKMEGRDGTD